MLLFADGFETFGPYDIWRKWGGIIWSSEWSQIPPQIVHGSDTTYSPAKLYATRPDGRAMQGTTWWLWTYIKPSRTVFVGLAARSARAGADAYNSTYGIKIDFMKGCPYNKTANPTPQVVWYYPGVPHTLIASCQLVIAPSYIDVTWTFVGTGTVTKTGRINTSANLTNGDFRYFQVGMTLMGNVAAQPQAWAEVRLGGRGTENLVFSNIMTAAETGGDASFLISGVRLGLGYQGSRPQVGIDDVYICNDEGEHNNIFLGNVKVRRVSVSGDGSENNSVPFGETYRFRTVDEDYIDTVNNLPVPLPDPEAAPLFIPWEPFAGNYLTIEEYGDRQLMRFNSLSDEGSYSKIHGAVLHALMQPLYLDTPATIKAVRKLGIEALIESNPMDAPLVQRAQYEARQFIWENDETIEPGGQYARWTPATIDGSEWGFELVPVEIAPEAYDPAIARINIAIYDTVAEEIDFSEMMHRYFEEFVDDRFDAAGDPTLEYVWAFYDALVLESFTEGNRGGNRFLNETLEFSEYLPYTILFASEFIDFVEDVFFQYVDTIAETLDTADWADGYWEELFTDTLEATDDSAIAFLATLEEMFGLEEPYLWDNHELIEDEIAIDADEPWDNHELLEEYLYPDDFTQNGVGLIAEDVMGIAEDHHDGYWVELSMGSTTIVDSVLTQHWRYETMFGMVINSWQVAPIEQTGSDGDHTGDNPWGA